MLKRSPTLAALFVLALSVAATSALANTEESAGDSAEARATEQPLPLTEMPIKAEEGSGAVVLSNSDYRIGPADELEIDVFQVPELSGTERVNSRGQIKMPLIGSVVVAGLTQEQAEDLIAELYGKDYLQDPQINIDIVEYVSQQVTLLGAVAKPGVYPLRGKTTLMQALALAGGTGRLADEEEIVVFRTDKNGEVIGYVVNLEEIQLGRKKDPEVIGSDRIVVPESGSKSFIKGISDTLRGFIGFRPY